MRDAVHSDMAPTSRVFDLRAFPMMWHIFLEREHSRQIESSQKQSQASLSIVPMSQKGTEVEARNNVEWIGDHQGPEGYRRRILERILLFRKLKE